MNVDNLSGAIISTTFSNIAFSIALLAIVALFVIKPIFKKKKIEMSAQLPVVMLLMVAGFGLAFGSAYNSGQELREESKAFSEHLKNDYGVTTESSFEEVESAARRDRIVVFKNDKGNFEVRPHLDGSILTFFRVDNGAQINPKS